MTILRRSLWIFVLLIFAVLNRAMAQLASFSFGTATNVSGWTRLSGDPAQGAQTATMNGITISSIGSSSWSSAGTNNNLTINDGAPNGTYFPAVVMATGAWFNDNGTTHNLALFNVLWPQIKVSGLNPDSTYTLRMTGSWIYDKGPTQYTVAGRSVSGSQTLVTYNNTSQGVTFQQVQPDTTGVISIYVNATTTSTLAFISGVQVFSGSSNVGVPVVALTSPANGTIISEGSDFSIAATASETAGTIRKVEFYADTTKIGEADAAPYTMTWTDPDPGGYVLTAKATDTVGTISTVSINLGVESLNYFWSTTGNAGNNGDSNFVGTVDTNRLAFRTNNIERMTILKDGTIGIGTKNTDGYLLAVNGTAIFTKVKVKPAGSWPDYVFRKNYELPGLEDLERYIALHHHLPGIASEREVRDGVDVGDQQAAVLKKVEELTLYLIRENRALSEHNRQINAQNKQLLEQNARLEAQQKEIDELKALLQANSKH